MDSWKCTQCLPNIKIQTTFAGDLSKGSWGQKCSALIKSTSVALTLRQDASGAHTDPSTIQQRGWEPEDLS
jgi:hypothetical protein